MNFIKLFFSASITALLAISLGVSPAHAATQKAAKHHNSAYGTLRTVAHSTTLKQFMAKLGKTNRGTLVEIGAHWCDACQANRPLLKIFARRFKTSINVYSVDRDDNRTLAIPLLKAVGSDTLPTYIVMYSDGKGDTEVAAARYGSFLNYNLLQEWVVSSLSMEF